MSEYLKRDEVLSKADILTVHTRGYGSIEVVPVEYIADLPIIYIQDEKTQSHFFKDASEMQSVYQKLIDNKQLTKKAMCDLCVPFRDKYHLNDLQTLRIARKEMDLSEMVSLAERN